MSDTTDPKPINPTPPAAPLDWKHVVGAIIAAVITALLHQFGVIPVCGARAPVHDSTPAEDAPAPGKCEATGCGCDPCDCLPCVCPAAGGPVAVPNYGVDPVRLDAERKAYGPGFVPSRK